MYYQRGCPSQDQGSKKEERKRRVMRILRCCVCMSYVVFGGTFLYVAVHYALR